jgi:hypothetical protein
MGDHIRALHYYFRALNLQKRKNDVGGCAKTLDNIGLIYGEQGDIAKARAYFF